MIPEQALMEYLSGDGPFNDESLMEIEGDCPMIIGSDPEVDLLHDSVPLRPVDHRIDQMGSDAEPPERLSHRYAELATVLNTGSTTGREAQMPDNTIVDKADEIDLIMGVAKGGKDGFFFFHGGGELAGAEGQEL